MADLQKRTGAEDWLEMWAWIYLVVVTLAAVGAVAMGSKALDRIEGVPQAEATVAFYVTVGVGWLFSVGIVPLYLVIANISRLLRK